MTTKWPWFPWYPLVFENDEAVKLMSMLEEGIYRRLLDHQWSHGNVPADVTELARICKNTPPAMFKLAWKRVGPCFLADPRHPDRLMNRKLESVRREQAARAEALSEAGKAGARGRWKGHR